MPLSHKESIKRLLEKESSVKRLARLVERPFVRKLLAKSIGYHLPSHLEDWVAESHRLGFARKTGARDLRALMQSLFPVDCERAKLIRLGPDGDGGYLVPDDLEGIEACFSPGVASVSGFEKDCADRGMKVFMADLSVDKPADTHELFSFISQNVGAVSRGDVISMDDWVNASMEGDRSDLLLQIDIEGAEYETFLGTSDALMRRFRIIVAEFHFLDNLHSYPFYKLATPTFEKILDTHSCVHIHPNNCCGFLQSRGLKIPRVMEFTFLRNDRIDTSSFYTAFPHPLDSDNVSKSPSLSLPRCWYSGVEERD